MSEHVVIENIQRVFTQGARELHVLRGASLSLAAGEVVALVGPSGSGKSSLLHIVGLLEKPDAGVISLRGTTVDTDNDSRRTEERLRHIGFVYQFHNLLPEFTAQENIALAGRLAGQGRNKSLQSALEAMERLGLADRATHLPSQLSGGEQQRVAIARALASARAMATRCCSPPDNCDGKWVARSANPRRSIASSADCNDLLRPCPAKRPASAMFSCAVNSGSKL